MLLNNPGSFATVSNGVSMKKKYLADFEPHLGRNLYPVAEGAYINDVLFVPSCSLGVGYFDHKAGFHLSRSILNSDSNSKATVEDMNIVGISFKLLFSPK